jgi:hypothetical protein
MTTIFKSKRLAAQVARKSLRTLVAATGLLIAHEATATVLDNGSDGFTDDNPFAQMATVSDTDLADMRGGFIAGGLNISFGVDVLSLVNGTPIIQYSFTDANLPGAPGVPDGLQHIVSNNGLQNVIQVGNGNRIIDSFSGFEGMLTVIQNTLDNTVIQHFSTITIDISAANPAIAQMQNLNLSLGF